MKFSKHIISVVLLLALALAFASCGAKKNYTPADVAGTYERTNENFGGIDKFTITLNEDGTYQYYETMISSFIGMGNYEIDGNIVSMISDLPGLNGTVRRTYKFKADGKTLVYVADGSDNFTYVKLPDGAAFEKLKETD